MQNSPADTLPALPSSSPSTSTAPLTTWPTPTPRRARLAPSNPDPSTLARRDAAARAAKSLLHSTIRDDWTWPSPPPPPTPSSCSPIHWRERDPNSSSPSPEPTEAAAPDPYKYDTPDSLASVARSRKRKRRARVLEELRWNEGLRTYMARRDAWTGGVLASSPPPAAPSSTSPTPSATPPSPDLLEFVPLPPPLLPANNPIRASITPATYASIYTKVVTQGLTPTIPINLADVTRAMVQGWKADGEWPAVANGGAVVEAPVAKRAGKRRGLMEGLNLRGVGRVKRVLGLGGEEGEGG